MTSSSDSSISSDGLEKLGGFPLVVEVEETEEEGEDKCHSSGPKDERNHLGSFSSCWTVCINWLRRPVSNTVLAITHHAATNPYLYIVGVIHLSLSLIAFGLFTNFDLETDSVVLYGVRESRITEHRQWIDNQSGFGQYNARNFLMLIHADGKNVIGDEGVRRCFTALDAVTTTYGYDEVCSSTSFENVDGEDTCEVFGVTRFWNGDFDTYENEIYTDDDVFEALSASTYPDATTVDLPQILGNYQQVNGSVTFAESFTITIPFPVTSDATNLEKQLIGSLLKIQEEWDKEFNSSFRLEVQASRSLSDESGRSILSDMPLIPLAFFVMSSFICVVFWRWHKVKSRTLVGFGAVVSVLLAVMSGYGLLFLCGVPFSMITQILPFVMFGIGLDDAFIIAGAFDKTDPRKDSVDRIHDTFEEVGLSIALTTMTTSLAFGLGAMSSIPSVEWLAYYAFPAVIFDFLYQITFFVAILVIDERRAQSNRMDCCFCIEIGSRKVTHENNATGNQDASPLPDDHYSYQKFVSWFADQILRPWVKVSVIVFFVALTTACAVSATKLKEEFKMADVVPEDSYLLRFFDSFDEYGQRGIYMPVAYFRNVDQSDEVVQQEMENFINDLVKMKQIQHQPPLFWLRDFKKFVNTTAGVFGLPFEDQLLAFLEDPGYQLMYGSSIMLDENGQIASSRCTLYMTNLDNDNVEAQIETLHDQRRVSSSQLINQGVNNWNFFTMEPSYYLWEFFYTAGQEVWTTAAMAIISVSVVGFLFIPHWSAVFYVFPMITILCIDLLGYLQFCGITINAVSYMGVIMSIGLLIDFIMHILLRYYESAETTREAKIRDTIKSMGAALILGGLSTCLGVLPLAFSSSKLLRTLFTTFIGMLFLGLSHGLVLLPVVLSLVGTTECIRIECKEAPSLHKEDSDLIMRPQKQRVRRHIEIDVTERERKNSGNFASDQSLASTAVSSVTVSVDGSGTSEGTEVIYAPHFSA